VLDAIPVASVGVFRQELPPWLDQHAGPTVAAIEQTRRLDDAGRSALLAALRSLAERHVVAA
jgi:hypothetical protein